jgi:hypothetical protein
MDSTTAVCRECNKRFPLSRRSNQHRRASGSRHRASRFCSPACKQSAYRQRNANRPRKASVTAYATVTRLSQLVGNIDGSRAPKTVLGAEIYGRYRWEDRVSAGGVPIKVARLRQSVLVR